ncbi:hypothetical protein L7E55_07040 [Pelotomaculum isophthalicicum JI]|uniref:Uncharacterized protein n=1 Tax=Pelotomaculum isophthalicicum JI TaxID=947010 RepID=A0A9X4H260_9FIRM|nr:hypothetical protein [Pelotomaculum isophthalicicum]MDF9408116.1 hypothetical protein [Pelotomaculum isophthalicicum JI]
MNIKKHFTISFLIIALILTSFCLVTRANKRIENKSENINFKILDENGTSSMFMKTIQSKITFYLKITPDIKKPYPELFTIFMNGKQIECLWDNNTEYTSLYYTTINPNEDRLIEITINNIPKGLNTLQFGTVYLPNKIDFQEEELFDEKYSLDLTPFTIVRNDNINNNYDINWSEESIFNNYNKPSFIDKNMPVGISGILSFSNNDLTSDLISNVNEYKEIYYYWQNTDEKIRKVRYSLLIDWEQVPWPTGEMFIDVSVNPGDIFYKDLLLSEIVKNKNCQLSIVAFIDPDKSFWYFNNNELKANHYGALSYATLRNIILSS